MDGKQRSTWSQYFFVHHCYWNLQSHCICVCQTCILEYPINWPLDILYSVSFWNHGFAGMCVTCYCFACCLNKQQQQPQKDSWLHSSNETNFQFQLWPLRLGVFFFPEHVWEEVFWDLLSWQLCVTEMILKLLLSFGWKANVSIVLLHPKKPFFLKVWEGKTGCSVSLYSEWALLETLKMLIHTEQAILKRRCLGSEY